MKFLITMIFLWSSLALGSDLTPELRAVQDEELFKPHIGFAAGMSNPEGSFNAGETFSLEYGLQPYIPFSYTVKASYGDYFDGDRNFSRMSFLLEGKYNFGGETPIIRHSYIGLGAGPAWESGSIDNGMGFVFYPQIGFDLPLRSVVEAPVSFGLNSSYLVSTSATPDTFNVTGVVKYWY